MKTGYQVARLLAYVIGLVNQDLLLHIEYLAAENRILGHTTQPGCGSPMENVPLWPRSRKDSGERVWQQSRKWLRW